MQSPKGNLIRQYVNGNCTISIFSDGTKIREWDGRPNPLVPESIDLKITDFCDAACAWCHESSTIKGKHANIDTIFEILKETLPGTEIAIGGGDPTSHPALIPLLEEMRKMGLIVNLTLNSRHINDRKPLIEYLRQNQLIYGLGVSYEESKYLDIQSIVDQNTVIHMILGIDSPNQLKDLYRRGLHKFLLLGYKQFGRGLRFFKPEIRKSILHWRSSLCGLTSFEQLELAFDNLALEQLNIKDRIDPEVWNKHFMGEDGTHTMYIDAVEDSFSVTSATTRQPRNNRSLYEMFSLVKQQSNGEHIK